MERLILSSATRHKVFEAMNSINSDEVYQASKTMVAKAIFLSMASRIRSLARSILLLKVLGGAFNGDVGFKVDGKMFGVRDEAGSDSDVAIFCTAKDTTVLELSAFGFFGVWFRAGGVINGHDAVSRRSCGMLILEDF